MGQWKVIMRKLILAAILAAVPLNAGALELLLEANRGESGTIGYVDIDRVFKEYSGTSNAREEFVAEIKKKENELTAKKTAIFTMKAEMAKLRQEREFALTLPSLMETRKSVDEAAAQAKKDAEQAAAAAAQAKAAQEAATAAAQAAVQPAAPASTQPAAALPPGLPGAYEMPEDEKAAGTQAEQPAKPAAQPAAALPATPKPAAAEGIEMPGVGKVPFSHFKFSVSTSVPEIDAALQKKDTDLKKAEDELKVYQKQAEKELLDYESRRTELILGRIYIAIKELATKESVSVVVDKRNILYGQNAVDLTGKLLEKLETDGL